MATEITNYNTTSYQSSEKFKGVRDRLNEIARIHGCKRLFIASFEKNFVTFLRECARNNKDGLVLGI